MSNWEKILYSIKRLISKNAKSIQSSLTYYPPSLQNKTWKHMNRQYTAKFLKMANKKKHVHHLTTNQKYATIKVY